MKRAIFLWLFVAGCTQVAAAPPAHQARALAISTSVTEAFVVMKGSQVDAVFINADSNDSNAELASEQRAGEIAAASFDNPQDVALSQAAWIARVPVNPDESGVSSGSRAKPPTGAPGSGAPR